MTKAGAGGTGEQLSPPLFLGILVHLIRITAFGILGGGVALNRLSMQRRVLESRHWPFWAVLGPEAWVRRFCPARVWRTLFEVVHPVWVPHRPTWHGPHWALRLEQKLSLVTALLSRKAVSLPAEKLLTVPAFRSSALPAPPLQPGAAEAGAEPL